MDEHWVLAPIVVTCNCCCSVIIEGETPIHDRITLVANVQHSHHLNLVIHKKTPINVLFTVEKVYLICKDA